MTSKHTEPPKATQPKTGASIESKPGTAYSQISRMLSEDDLKNPAVVKLIISENDSLKADNEELKKMRGSMTQTQLENVELRGKLKTWTAFEIISTGTIAVGSAIATLNISNTNYFYLGIILIGVGILAKAVKIK